MAAISQSAQPLDELEFLDVCTLFFPVFVLEKGLMTIRLHRGTPEGH